MGTDFAESLFDHVAFKDCLCHFANCMYAMGMLVGAYIIRFVPEVASWLIPGGVSSGTGSVAGSAAMGITSAAGGMAGSMAGSAMKGTGSAVRSLVK